MRGYLEAMNVTDLAIQAHEKGEAETDTVHTIQLTNTRYKIKKLSRVNDLTLDLTLGVEDVKTMPSAVSTLSDAASTRGSNGAGESSTQPPSPPTLELQQQAGIRMKRTIAVSDGLHHVRVKSSMPTMNGLAEVTDEKTLVRERTPGGEEHTMLVQQLTIVNRQTGKTNTTTRYFLPHTGVGLGIPAATAGGGAGSGRRSTNYRGPSMVESLMGINSAAAEGAEDHGRDAENEE